MDKVLQDHVDVICSDCYDDDDGVIVIFGAEGAGKSLLESQIVRRAIKKLKCKFSIERDVHYLGKDYIKSSLNKGKRTINCLDEARRTINKMRMMSGKNQDFMDFLAECRSQNQLHLEVLPNYYDLDPDVATRRLKLLIKVIKKRHPVTKKLIRGEFQIIRTNNKNQLKDLYKKRYEEIPKNMIAHTGKFDNEWGWDEEEYKTKKEREKKKNYLDNEEGIHFTNRDYSIINIVMNYIKSNRLITKTFSADEALMRAFHRLSHKTSNVANDNDSTV